MFYYYNLSNIGHCLLKEERVHEMYDLKQVGKQKNICHPPCTCLSYTETYDKTWNPPPPPKFGLVGARAWSQAGEV
jgi:hypothetical protein